MDKHGRDLWTTERILAHLADTDDPRQSEKSELETIPYLTRAETEEVPKPVQGVYKSQFKSVWLDTISKEVEGLKRNNTWTVVDAPPVGEKAIDSKWVFQWK